MRSLLTRLGVLVLIMGLLVGTSSLGTVPQAAAQNRPAIRITVKEDFIASLLDEQFASLTEGQQMPIQLQDPSIDLVPGSQLDFTATADVPFLGRTVTLKPTIAILLSVNNNTLSLDIGDISLEGVNLPVEMIAPQLDQVEQTAEVEINRALADLADSVGLTLSSIRTTDTLLILELSAQ